MSTSWKTVRVFISSTFRDMHAERDHLVKVTFPRLREWCEERRLRLVDIDLRWGVTKEQADNGKALDICLKEIDGSRPFFLCILGERYGYVPGKLPEEDVSHFRGLQAQTHKSITHLEIIHAALESFPDPTDKEKREICDQCSFYFRDVTCLPPPTAYEDTMDRAEFEKTFFEKNEAQRDKLRLVKKEISEHERWKSRVRPYRGQWNAAAENPEDDKLKGRLTELKEFGEQVEKDLQEAINERFAEYLKTQAERASMSDEDRAFEDELALHEAFIESRTQIHIPRTDIEKQLSNYAAGDDPRPLILSGPPGGGKSAILAHWVKPRLESDHSSPSSHPSSLTIARFIGASPASTSLHGLLGCICEELRRSFKPTEEVEEETKGPDGSSTKQRISRPMQVPVDPVEIQSKWPRFLAAAGKQGRVVIVIDAVNQLERNVDPRMAYWIPYRLPAGIRLIVSALDHGEASKVPDKNAPMVPVTPSTPAPGWLSELRRREPMEVPVPDLTDDDRTRIIRELPSVFCKTLDTAQMALLLRNEATRNPLFLTVALEELRVFGSFEKVSDAIAALPKLDDAEIKGDIALALDRLFGAVLDRLDRESKRQTTGLVPRLFSLLASSRDGLSEQELDGLLARALPDAKPEDRSGQMQIVLRQVRGYLQRKRALGTVLVDFYHRSFWKAVVGKYLKDDETKAAAHVDIAEFFTAQDWFTESLEEQRARAKRLPPTPRPANLRKVVELPWQRLEAAKRVGKDDPKSPYWDEVASLLLDWQFLEAKAEAQP